MPDLTPDQFAVHMDTYLTEQVLPIIAEHGWMIQAVFGTATDHDAPFAYTVGLTAAGLPELVVSGLPYETSGSILNDAARRHLADEIQPGATVDDIASVPFRAVAAPLAEVNMARNLYGLDRVRAVQLVWPDDAGNYPGDVGWKLGNGQPIYNEDAL